MHAHQKAELAEIATSCTPQGPKDKQLMNIRYDGPEPSAVLAQSDVDPICPPHARAMFGDCALNETVMFVEILEGFLRGSEVAFVMFQEITQRGKFKPHRHVDAVGHVVKTFSRF